MKKDQIIILEDRGLISISGKDSKEYLQNIITNDINKVSENNSIFAALLSPQGKYLYEFFVIKSKDGFLLDCYGKFTEELIKNLTKYKLRSKVEINNLSNKFVVGIISLEKFKELQINEKKNTNTFIYNESAIFIDSRKKELGGRIISSLEKLYLTIKRLDLKISNIEDYLDKSYSCGIPVKGIENLQDKLFSLEANLEELSAIDFKKGCYIGQENTARMKIKAKLRKKMFAVIADGKTKIGDEILFNDVAVGKILINSPYPFGIIKITEPQFSNFKNRHLTINGIKAKLLLV